MIVGLELLTRGYFTISKKDIKAFKNHPGRYTSSSFTGYKLTPNWELNHDTLKERINSLGFKNPEIKINKDKGTYRIICVGGSIVYGNNHNHHTWPYMLEELFKNQKLKGLNVEVINAGIPGYTSYHIITQFITKLLDLDPDLIIYSQMFTELWYYSELENKKIIGESFNQYKSPPIFNEILDSSYAVTLIRAIFRKIMWKNEIENIPFNSNSSKIYDDETLHYYFRNINIIAAICENFDINLLLCPPISLFKQYNSEQEINKIADYSNKSFYLEYIKEGKNKLKRIADKYTKTYFFDLSSVIEPSLDLLQDRYHPTSLGNKKIANQIYLLLYENHFYQTNQ